MWRNQSKLMKMKMAKLAKIENGGVMGERKRGEINNHRRRHRAASALAAAGAQQRQWLSWRKSAWRNSQ
jgi:hypothetical protein